MREWVMHENSFKTDTLCELMRELHIISSCIAADPENTDYHRNYITQYALIWDCVVGREMDTHQAEKIFGADPTDQEIGYAGRT